MFTISSTRGASARAETTREEDMPQRRHSVATSLDGHFAGLEGEFDWIVIDPEIDFAAMYAGFSW